MKRPTKGGLLIGVALAIPILIELRTLLVWIGLDVPIDLYVPAAIVLVGALAAGLWVFGEEVPDEGNRSKA
jgi:hypothetical protein